MPARSHTAQSQENEIERDAGIAYERHARRAPNRLDAAFAAPLSSRFSIGRIFVAGDCMANQAILTEGELHWACYRKCHLLNLHLSSATTT